MKKRTVFADIEVVCFMGGLSLILFAIWFFLELIMGITLLSVAYMIMILLFEFLFFFVSGYRIAFVLVQLDSEKINNAHISFRWEEIEHYKVLEVDPDRRPFRFRRFTSKYSDMLCIGKTYGNDFLKQKPKECICLALTQKNILLLEQMSGGKSPAINRLLTYYIHDSKRKSSGRFGD